MLIHANKGKTESLRVFIGISFVSRTRARYALTFQNGTSGRLVSYPVQEMRVLARTENRYDYVVLRLIRDICNLVAECKQADTDVNLDIYSGSHMISFIWEMEIKHQQKVSETTPDALIWMEIMSVTKKYGIRLSVHGEGNMMNSINHSEQVRAANA